MNESRHIESLQQVDFRFLCVPDDLRHLLHRVHREAQRVVVRVEMIRDLSGVGKFIRGFVESHGERVDFRYPEFMHLLHDRGRIQPTREVHSHGNVAHQLSLHGLFD